MGFIRELFVESLRGNGADKITGAAAWLTALLVIGCVATLIDKSFAHTQKQRVMVVGKRFAPAYTSFIPQTVGNGTILTPVHNPDSWHITVSNNGKLSECQVDMITHSNALVGDMAIAIVGKGFIGEQEYCEGFQIINK